MKTINSIDGMVKEGCRMILHVNRSESIKSFLQRLKIENMEESVTKGDVSCYKFSMEVESIDYKKSSDKRFDNKVDRIGDIVAHFVPHGNIKTNACFRQKAEVLETKWIFRAHLPSKKKTKITKSTKIFHAEIENAEQDSSCNSYSPSKGTLPDGRKYVVYRFLLYNDGFNAFRAKSGSMGGFYILLLGFPPNGRMEHHCVRKISVAPPDASAGETLETIQDDIIKGMTEGIHFKLGKESFVIFLDPVGYTADAPTVSVMTGTMATTVDSPCHACCFRKGKQENFMGSDMVLTV